jgi:hypothetical protein
MKIARMLGPYKPRISRLERMADKAGRYPPRDCECCGRRMLRPCFDHCHATGAFRGWLCMNCNAAIGALGDTAEAVFKAWLYLTRKR